MEVETADEKKRVSGASPRKKGASGGGGLEWELERQFDAFDREMLLMAAAPGAEHPKQRRRPFAADLLQNCDLPPPAKLFGPVPTLQRLGNAVGTEQKAEGDGGGSNDSLLRALRLSQSRAREAEEKLAAAGASNGELAALLVRDSVVLSAHRRWVMILETENSVLRRGVGSAVEEDGGAGDARHGVAAWWVAFAVCVGIAGVGLAMGNLLF